MTRERLACVIITFIAVVMSVVNHGSGGLLVALVRLLVPALLVLFPRRLRFYPILMEAHRRGEETHPIVLRILGWLGLGLFAIVEFVGVITGIVET